MKEVEQSRQENGENATYSLTAIVKLVFSLQTKALAEYRNALGDVRTADEYLLC